jgi:hypothetical protein
VISGQTVLTGFLSKHYGATRGFRKWLATERRCLLFSNFCHYISDSRNKYVDG